jgi:predicted O-methyltransferase YrrM
MLTLRDLIEQPPLIHNNRSITWAIRPALARFLDETIGPGSVTLETGAGLSTLVILRKRPRQHTAVQPVPDEFAVILQFAERHQIDIHRFLPIVARSQDWLPRAELPDLDLVLVDGAHAFPVPFVDWYYGAEKLKVGGLMAVDDTHLLTGTILADFMDADPQWEPVLRDAVSHFAIYRKRVHPVHDDDWTRQPYVHDAYPTESIWFLRGSLAENATQPAAPVLNPVDHRASPLTARGGSGDSAGAPGRLVKIWEADRQELRNLQAQVHRLEHERAKTSDEVQLLRAALSALHQSRSMRLTRPLRQAARWYRTTMGRARGGAPSR